MNMLLASSVLCILLVSIHAYSQPDCTVECNLELCPAVAHCRCGTYLDYCKCCSFCLGCPGEKCSLVALEQCANGTTCKPPEGTTGIMLINGPGWCK